MSAPLVVNTRDGVCWTRRTVTSGGIALYAPEGVCRCPEFVMATLAELAEHGIAGSADVLPAPVGPAPLSLSAARLSEAVERGAHLYEFGGDATADEWNRLAGDDVPLLAREVRRQAAEIVSLNEALTVAAEQLRADRAVEEPSSGGYPPALPWLALMDEDDRVEFLDELADSATVNQSSEVRLAEIERTCVTWRLIAEAQHGHNTAPGVGVGSPEMRSFREALAGSVDAVTAAFAPVAPSLEDPHDSPLHSDYRLPHDLPDVPSLPVPESCRLSPSELDDVSQYWFGGGER